MLFSAGWVSSDHNKAIKQQKGYHSIYSLGMRVSFVIYGGVPEQGTSRVHWDGLVLTCSPEQD